jgi:hypothetical protein
MKAFEEITAEIIAKNDTKLFEKATKYLHNLLDKQTTNMPKTTHIFNKNIDAKDLFAITEPCIGECHTLTDANMLSQEYLQTICSKKIRYTYPTILVIYLKFLVKTHNETCSMYIGSNILLGNLITHQLINTSLVYAQEEIYNTRNSYGSIFAKHKMHQFVLSEFNRLMSEHKSIKKLRHIITSTSIKFNTTHILISLLFVMYASPDKLLTYITNNYTQKYINKKRKNLDVIEPNEQDILFIPDTEPETKVRMNKKQKIEYEILSDD